MRAHTTRKLAGFTLIEMVIVVAIILVLVGLVVPAASSLWAERKRADAINTIQGLLMTTRVKALGADGIERGFFAFLDGQGVQRFAPIRQHRRGLLEPAWQNVFEITEDSSPTLPAPMRVVPRYVVDDPNDPKLEAFEVFDDDELANNDFDSPSGNQAQRHRNFFTMVYSTDGELLINRDVLIQDFDSDNNDKVGDRTGLNVGPGPPNQTATTAKFYNVQSDSQVDFDLSNPGVPIEFLVRDDPTNDTALNFPSVDGPLVYDDSLLNEITDPAEKRSFLLRTAQPLYVSRFTGKVILGPVGENETP